MLVKIESSYRSSFEVYCVGGENTIGYIRNVIVNHCIPGLKINSFQLCYQGRILRDSDTLNGSGIKDRDTIRLTLSYHTGI